MFVNETKYDVETNLKVFDNLAWKKFRVMFVVAAVIMLICGAVTIAFEIVSSSEEGADLFFPIFCLVVGVVFGVMVFSLRPFVKFSVKKSMQGKEGINRFAFNEEGYEIIAALNDGTTSTTTGNYDGFSEVKDYQDMWLLCVNQSTVFAVNKSGMVEGSADDLTIFLAKALGSRYKVCYKIK